MRCLTRRSVMAAGLGLVGCAALDQSRLGRLYGEVSRPADQPPLILIPGAFGSSLRDRRDGRELWPVSAPKLLLGNYRELALPIDPDTLEADASQAEAYAVLREGLGRDFYGSVIDTLERVGGYGRCRRGQPPLHDRPCSLYVYLYDFRLDNVRAARGLASLIESIRAEHADPRLQVDIVAHSNGGLVARYFIRHGTTGLPASGSLPPSYAGAQAVRRLLLVGTPNLGTLQPVLSLLRGEEIGLRHIPPEVDRHRPGHPAADAAPRGALAHRPARQHDRRGPLRPCNVARTRLVLVRSAHRSADHRRAWRRRRRSPAPGAAAGIPGPQPDRRTAVRRIVRGPAGYARRDHLGVRGDCEPTLARVVAESVAGVLHPRVTPAAIVAPGPHDCVDVMFEHGDTVVTRSSLLGRHTLDVAAPRTEDESLRVAHALFLLRQPPATHG